MFLDFHNDQDSVCTRQRNLNIGFINKVEIQKQILKILFNRIEYRFLQTQEKHHFHGE